MSAPAKVTVADKFALFTEQWAPRLAARYNGNEVRLAPAAHAQGKFAIVGIGQHYWWTGRFPTAAAGRGGGKRNTNGPLARAIASLANAAHLPEIGGAAAKAGKQVP